MLHLICNKKAMGMVEVLIAIMLTSVAIISILSLQSSAWKTMAKSDYVGRAAEMLHNRLEAYECNISNPCSAITTGDQAEETIRTSGQDEAVKGDVEYTINANITEITELNKPQTFVVTVTITWTGNNKGISESLSITRQDIYKFGC